MKLLGLGWRHFSEPIAIGMVVFGLLIVSFDTHATPAFARQNNVTCQACHSVSFPRLNALGEKFMRNGFKFPGMPARGSDDEAVATENLFLIKDLSKIISVRGKFTIAEKNENSAKSTTGSPEFFAIFASGQIAPDVSLWAEAETNTDTGETEVHNYMVNFTNLLSNNSTVANIRVGGFTPTEWTSWSDQKRVIDSASSHPGVYRGKHNFAKVGNGLGTRTGIEYYGYTESLLWAAGIGEPKGNFAGTNPDSNKNYWLVGRYDFVDTSSISLLYMDHGTNANGVDVSSYTLSGNYRVIPKFELQAQYSQDDSGTGNIGDVSGYGLQGTYSFNTKSAGILRYDTTDNGAATDETETQLTAAFVWAPWMNVKITSAYVSEIDRAGGGNTDDSMTIQLQFAM